MSWSAYEDAVDRLRSAFPDRWRSQQAVLRRWVIRAPDRLSSQTCAMCGLDRPDALELPKRLQVSRVVVAESRAEEDARTSLGPEPPASERDARRQWAELRRRIEVAKLQDIAFRAVDWKTEPRLLVTILRNAGERWICDRCAEAAAFFLDGDDASDERILADLRRALDGDSPILSALEHSRATAVAWSKSAARCRFCRAVGESLVFSWFQICARCAAKAADACGAQPSMRI